MSDELERAVLGALAIQPSLMEGCLVRAYDFTPGRLRGTFNALSEIWESERPNEIDPLLLAERLGGNGATEYIAELFNGSIKLDPDVFCRRVSELRKRFLTSRIESVVTQQAKTGQLDLEELRADLEEYQGLEDEKAFDAARVLMTGTEMQAMDLKIEYAIDKLAPSRSITLIHGPGGLAKTWLALCMVKAVSEGREFLGLKTKQRLVTYIDYENPLPMLVERVRKLDIRDARFWHLSASTRPPKLDSDDWVLFKSLVSGFLVFDTARSSFDGDENKSQDVGLVMNRLKELRELDNEIILLHHTPRANERQAKGSTAWEDLADHVLAFYKVKKETLEETDEEINYDPSALLSLGTGRKTRYEPFRIYITLDPENGGFALSESPDQAALNALAEYIRGEGLGLNQGDLFNWAKEAGIGPKKKASFIAMLNRGEGRLWITRKGLKGAKHYEPVS
jgi:hypothetical protein